MSRLVVRGDAVLGRHGWSSGPIVIEDGLIAEPAAPPGPELDASGLRLVPGLIDLQINGAWGVDFATSPGGIWDVGRRLPETGVTTFLPTLTTHGAERLGDALTVLKAGPPAGWVGAEPLGWHLEGPWLSPARRGAHPGSGLAAIPDVLPPDMTPSGGVRIVTLAPELPGAEWAVRQLVEQGVVVSCGHSAATVAEADDALDWGATMTTHLFNAMPPIHHRQPGLAVAAALHFPHVGLIADGHHVAPAMIDLAWRLARERVVLVTDAVAGMGVSERAVATLSDGTLSGAHCDLAAGLRNLIDSTGAQLEDAVLAVTATPSQCLGLDDRGVIEPGRRADIVGLDVENQVVLTIVGGEVVHDLRSGR